MTPDDPRHGTYAGFQLHKTDRETPCPACKTAAYKYTKAMKLRLARTGSNLVELGEPAYEIVTRYPVRLIAQATGVSDPKLYTFRTTGPTAKVHVKTRDAILNVNTADLWTPIGIRRRVRALTALGHSAPAIAEAAGLSKSSVLKIRGTGDMAFIRRPTAVVVRRAYDAMSMTLPPLVTPHDRAAATRARDLAATNGWAAPLSWDFIDDPDEQPKHNARGTNNPTEMQKHLDMAVVWRLVDERTKPRLLTRAEALEAYRILIDRGVTAHQIEHEYGLKPERYKEGTAA